MFEPRKYPGTLSQPSILILLIAGMVLSACNDLPKVDTPTDPKMPSIEELKKSTPALKPIDTKSYTDGKIVRDASGRYVVPWQERTKCDGPASCEIDVINEITKEVAVVNGTVQSPWRETGNGQEIARREE